VVEEDNGNSNAGKENNFQKKFSHLYGLAISHPIESVKP
jgi:hypothetical protein